MAECLPPVHDLRTCVIPLPDEALKTLDSHQASLVKQSLGLPKRSHHSKLLRALNITPVSEVVRGMKAAHFNRLMKTHSPARELSTYLMSKFVCTGRVYERTLVGQLIQMGISPIDTVFRYRKMRRATPARDGVVDSLRTLVFHYDFNAAGSTQHKLVKHLYMQSLLRDVCCLTLITILLPLSSPFRRFCK